MPVDVIVGGQGGDEGKGKIAEWLSMNKNYSICARVSAPQAGHSVYYKEKRIGLALLPCGFVNPNTTLLIGRGALISVKKLLYEIGVTGIALHRLGVDYKATVVTDEHLQEERENSHLMGNIGSVGTGVGPCRRDKIMRKNLLFAEDIPELKYYLTDTKDEILEALDSGDKILLEGDHGAKLDLIHGEYPYVTSRSVNASSLLGELGVGPKSVRDIYIVLKPYTTRVGTGPLEREIFDEKILKWAHEDGGETGTVSKRLRRIGRFEWENVRKVIRMNSATDIAITHMDLPNFFWNSLGFGDERGFIRKIQEELCKDYPYPKIKDYPYPKISLLSYGPKLENVVQY